MLDASDSIQFEGTWEEILLRGPELTGRRVRVMVLPDETTPPLAEIARRWADESSRLSPEPGPEARGIKGEIRRLLAEKYRHQGLRL